MQNKDKADYAGDVDISLYRKDRGEKGVSPFLDTGLFAVLFVSKACKVGQLVCSLHVCSWVGEGTLRIPNPAALRTWRVVPHLG